MKIKLLTLYSKLLLFLLGMLGIQSCTDPVDEYGCPSAKYKIKGTVVSKETDEKIEGIQAVLVDSYNGEENIHYADTVYTNNEGQFFIERNDIPHSEFILKLRDVDGKKNGEFSDKDILIDLKNIPLHNGDGNWYKGETTQDLEKIQLETREDNQ